MGVQNRQRLHEGWSNLHADVSKLLFIPSVYSSVTCPNGVLCVVEMDAAKQRIRVAATRQKEERKNKEAAGEASSTPNAVAKVTKRKPDGGDSCPTKRVAVTSGTNH